MMFTGTRRFVSPLLVIFCLLIAPFAAADHVAPAKHVKAFVNVRGSPDAAAPKVGKLGVEERATLLDEAENWRKIRLIDGVIGYVNKSWTRITPSDDFEHGESAFEGGDYEKAGAIWEPLAQAGDARAQFGLGNLYVNGLGLERDEKTAADWYRKSADQGYALAQFNLGNAYKHGRGVFKDDTSANAWWVKAAEQGLASAQYNLGLQYWFGRGVTKSEQIATEWFARAAQAGHPKAIKLFEAQPGGDTEPVASETDEGSANQPDKKAPAARDNWIDRQSPGAYTIQVLATRDTQSLKDFMNGTPFTEPVGWFRFKKAGETWFALVHGAYQSKEQAQTAVRTLPASIKKKNVWIRPFADIHEIMRNN